jgi:integrase
LPGDTITLEKLLEEYGKRPGAADRSTTPIVKATVQGRRAVLDRRSKDPAGEPLPADAYVFGDEVGRRRHSIKTAWRLTCKRATIDGLHFHDLRREAGSRWMDAGVPLATIQRWLGHHNISQTSTYLAASGGGDADAMRAFERATGRLPNVAVSAGSNGPDQISSSSEAIEKTQSNPVVH